MRGQLATYESGVSTTLAGHVVHWVMQTSSLSLNPRSAMDYNILCRCKGVVRLVQPVDKVVSRLSRLDLIILPLYGCQVVRNSFNISVSEILKKSLRNLFEPAFLVM